MTRIFIRWRAPTSASLPIPDGGPLFREMLPVGLEAPDRTAPWDEVWQAMDTLITQGKITYVGSSNFAGWHIVQANEAAKARHFLGLVSEQIAALRFEGRQ
mgnify:CR=1 FL=1